MLLLKRPIKQFWAFLDLYPRVGSYGYEHWALKWLTFRVYSDPVGKNRFNNLHKQVAC